MYNLQPIDIAERLYRCHPVWFKQPTYRLAGVPGGFGRLWIRTDSWEVSWKIYIQDREHVMKCCEEAITNIGQLLQEVWD